VHFFCHIWRPRAGAAGVVVSGVGPGAVVVGSQPTGNNNAGTGDARAIARRPSRGATPTPTFAHANHIPDADDADAPPPTSPLAAPRTVDLKIPELADEGRWIDVNLSSQRVTAYEGAEAVNEFIVSTGTSAHPTVTGQFRVYVRLRSTAMAGPGYYLPGVPFTMYFYKGYALHGTYWHSNFGVPMSHGCVNLRTSDAEWLFNWASVGTLVNVTRERLPLPPGRTRSAVAPRGSCVTGASLLGLAMPCGQHAEPLGGTEGS
jgi:lipoprotein-anchoring transpeptidase ErfK/SrfK